MVCGIAAIVALSLPSVAVAQYGRDRDSRGGPFTRLEPGIAIAVRTTDPIDARDSDYRVFRGVVDRDVRGDKGRVAIPRGSVVELIVRRLRNNDLSLDLESVTVNGQRYATETDPNLIAGTRGDDSLVGAIVGAIKGGEVRGRLVRFLAARPWCSVSSARSSWASPTEACRETALIITITTVAAITATATSTEAGSQGKVSRCHDWPRSIRPSRNIPCVRTVGFEDSTCSGTSRAHARVRRA
jgi:hypothetical protein